MSKKVSKPSLKQNKQKRGQPAEKKAAMKNARTLPGPRPEQREQDVVNKFEVELRGFGHPSKVKRDHTLRLARVLHHQFGEEFTISLNGHPVDYDHLADDGHHPGHTKILDTEEEMEEAVAAAGSNSGGGD